MDCWGEGRERRFGVSLNSELVKGRRSPSVMVA